MNSTRRGTLALLVVIALGCVLYGTGALLGLPHSMQLWHSAALSRYKLDLWYFPPQKLLCSAPCHHKVAEVSAESNHGQEESALWGHSWTLMVSHTFLQHGTVLLAFLDLNVLCLPYRRHADRCHAGG